MPYSPLCPISGADGRMLADRSRESADMAWHDTAANAAKSDMPPATSLQLVTDD